MYPRKSPRKTITIPRGASIHLEGRTMTTVALVEDPSCLNADYHQLMKLNVEYFDSELINVKRLFEA